jgi:hypothetical protein
VGIRRVFGLRAGFLLALFGLALAVIGYWGPWVDHFTAALVVPGFDLAEYVKFLPEVRAQTVPVTRESFYLPALATGFCLAMLVGQRRPRLPLWATALLAALAAWLTLVVAPPVDLMARFVQDAGLRAEWGWQALLAGGGFLAVIVTLLGANRLPRLITSLLISLVAGVGSGIPLWQFYAVRPAIDRVYNKPVTLGWGLWLMPLGFGLAVIAIWGRWIAAEDEA